MKEGVTDKVEDAAEEIKKKLEELKREAKEAAINFLQSKITEFADKLDITNFDEGPSEQQWKYSETYKYWPTG